MTRPDPYPDLGLQAVREGLGRGRVRARRVPGRGARLGLRARSRRRSAFPFSLAWRAGARSGRAGRGAAASRSGSGARKSWSASRGRPERELVPRERRAVEGFDLGRPPRSVRGCPVVVAAKTISTIGSRRGCRRRRAARARSRCPSSSRVSRWRGLLDGLAEVDEAAGERPQVLAGVERAAQQDDLAVRRDRDRGGDGLRVVVGAVAAVRARDRARVGDLGRLRAARAEAGLAQRGVEARSREPLLVEVQRADGGEAEALVERAARPGSPGGWRSSGRARARRAGAAGGSGSLRPLALRVRERGDEPDGGVRRRRRTPSRRRRSRRRASRRRRARVREASIARRELRLRIAVREVVDTADGGEIGLLALRRVVEREVAERSRPSARGGCRGTCPAPGRRRAARSSSPSTHSPHFCAPPCLNRSASCCRLPGGCCRIDGERDVHQRRRRRGGHDRGDHPVRRSISVACGACAPNSLTCATIPAHCLAKSVASGMRERYPEAPRPLSSAGRALPW